MKLLTPDRRQDFLAGMGSYPDSPFTSKRVNTWVTDENSLYIVSSSPVRGTDDDDDDIPTSDETVSLYAYKGKLTEACFAQDLYGHKLIEKAISFLFLLLKSLGSFLVLHAFTYIIWTLMVEVNEGSLITRSLLIAEGIFSLSINGGLVAVSVWVICILGGRGLLNLYSRQPLSNPQDTATISLHGVKDIQYLTSEQIIDLVNTALTLKRVQDKRSEGTSIREKVGKDNPFYESITDEMERLADQEETLEFELSCILGQAPLNKDEKYGQKLVDWLAGSAE